MDDADEQQRRRDFINQVRSNNKTDMRVNQLELINRISKMKGPDKVAQWVDDSEERQRKRDEARDALTEQQREQLITVEQQIKQFVTQAIVNERAFITQVVGKAIAEMLDAEREDAKSELATEVRRLWATLSEVQATIASINKMASATGRSVIDLPNPLTRSH